MPSLLDRIQTIDQTPYYVKLLLYGPGGAGKTTLTGSAPNLLCMDVERSAEAFRRNPDLCKTPVFVPKNFNEMFEMAKLVVKEERYQTISIDSIGRAQHNQIRDYLNVETRAGTKRSKYLALWGDFRVSTNMLDELFVFLQEAPIHVILVGHAREYIDQETGNITRITPDITPGLSKAITELINVVAYLEVVSNQRGELSRKLTVNPINKIVAKNRLNIQEPTIMNPNFKEIFLS